MKHSYCITLLLIFASLSITAQNYLFPVKASGFHLGSLYSHLNTDGLTGNLWAMNVGYTIKGRFTSSFSLGREIDKHIDFRQNELIITSYPINIGFNYLVFKQEQHHTLLSFSVDIGYQYNHLSYKRNKLPVFSDNINTFLYGLSVYRNFQISERFTISPSIGLGRGALRSEGDSYGFFYQNYGLLCKLGKFYFSPVIQATDVNTYFTAMAGFIFPVAPK